MHLLLADISSGNTGFADILFLVAFILFALAVITPLPAVRPQGSEWWHFLVAAGLACTALGWLVL